MKNISRQPIQILPSGMIVNNRNLDYDDMQAILSESRGMPLSDMEKLYIDEMHAGLSMVADLLGKVMAIAGKEVVDKDKDLYKEVKTAIDMSKGLTDISSDLLGRGFTFTIKEGNERSNTKQRQGRAV